MVHVSPEEHVVKLKINLLLFALNVSAKTLNGESMSLNWFYVYDSLTGSNDRRRQEDHYRKKFNIILVHQTLIRGIKVLKS